MKKPQYTHGFVDRHGKARFYFRRKGHKQVPLPGLPWSPEFMTAWEAAMKRDATPALTIGANQTKPGTVDALVVAYFASSQFLSLSPSTRATYRGIIERFRKENGQRRIAHLQRDKLREMLGNRVKTPSAANNWLRMVRMLMRFAIELGMRNVQPLASGQSRFVLRVSRFGRLNTSKSTGRATRSERRRDWRSSYC